MPKPPENRPACRTGDTIVRVNRDPFRHTATARNRAFNIDLAPGAIGRTVPRTAGRIPYVCRFHPGMAAVLTVAA